MAGRRRWGMGMAGLLGWRNLAHDRSRFAVTLTGIVFAVVLFTMQVGLFLGFSDSTTTVIRHTGADLWILGRGARNFEVTMPIQERELYLARSVPGVARAEPLIIQFVFWKKPGGGDETVIVVGFDLDSGMAGPWSLAEGDPEALRQHATVAIDTIFADKLGVKGIGETVELNGHRARIVALTQGIRSFTTSPWVFASQRNALELTGLDEDRSNYVIVKVAAGVDPLAVRDALRAILPRCDVYTSEELANLTRDYWMYTTGAGASVLVSALLGLLVGAVIVAQVLYATTVDHLAEFGTLRAMGAPPGFIYKVILGQAAISAVLGHLLGIGVALLLAKGSEAGAAVILVPLPLAGMLFGVTLVMCVGASMVSIHKAMTIDPAMVFQR